MNTVKSVYYGWGTLIVAGGGAYYFAKRSINADRARRAEQDHQKRLAQYELEQATLHPAAASHLSRSAQPPPPAQSPANRPSVTREADRARRDVEWEKQQDDASSPSHEASADPAPTRHAPEDEGQKMREKSKYEAVDVYRSRKGDRFS